MAGVFPEDRYALGLASQRMALTEKGSPILSESGDDVTRLAISERVRRAETTMELTQRRLDTVDLIIQGATLRQVADRHGLMVEEVREDYRIAMNALNDRSADRVLDMREEITARQRAMVLANMAQARMGDVKAAAIVQRSDQILCDVWGLRYIRPAMEDVPRDPTIAAALSVYLAKVAERVGLAS